MRDAWGGLRPFLSFVGTQFVQELGKVQVWLKSCSDSPLFPLFCRHAVCAGTGQGAGLAQILLRFSPVSSPLQAHSWCGTWALPLWPLL